MNINIIVKVALVLMCLFETSAYAWGRRGHAMLCETAAYLVADDMPSANDLLKNHSFDLGFYCNVPDLIWKKPSTYSQEVFEHFMDLEIFDRVLRGTSVKNPLEMDQKAFDKTFPQIPAKAGRIMWRIRQLNELLMKTRDKLLATKDIKKDDRYNLQGEWLVRAGTLGHYIGDISMPMHMSENHDGEITKQKGIHMFYEDVMVNELLHAPGYDLTSEVWKIAQKRWKKEKASLAKKSLQELFEQESTEAFKEMPEALRVDRQVGHQLDKDIKKALPVYKKVISNRLAAGAVYMAEYLRRAATDVDFIDAYRFYVFDGAPEYVAPGK